MRHAHPLEWAWLVATLVAAWASLSSWIAAYQDWERVKVERAALAPKSLLSRIAKDAVTFAIVVSASMNGTMAVMLLSASIVALFFSPPPPDYKEVPQTLFLLSVLIGVSSINAAVAFYGRLFRYRLSTGYYERQAGNKAAGKPASQAIADAYKDKK